MASRSNLTHIRALPEEDNDGINEEAKELSVTVRWQKGHTLALCYAAVPGNRD